MEKGITYTTVSHPARIKLGLTLNEYCIADIIYHLSNNPSSKCSGWCYASKRTLGKLVGLSEQSIHTIRNKLIKLNLVERDEKTRYLRTTKKWCDNVIRKDTKESLRSGLRNLEGDTKETLGSGLKKLEGDTKESLGNNNSITIKDNLPLEAKGTPKNLANEPIKEDSLTQRDSSPLGSWFHQGLSSEDVVASRFPQAYRRFKKKTPAEYNSNNLLILFCIEFHKKYKMGYSPSGNGASPFGGKDSSNLKVLLTGQSPEIMAKVIPYFIRNYEKVESLPNDRPSVSILYGWRNTIIPNCLLGEPKGSAAERGRRGEITDEEWEEERDDSF